MKAAVIVYPGSNRESDMQVALERAGASVVLVWHGETTVPVADLIVLPGGFAHGDYLRAGAMAAHSPVMAEVKAAAGRGVPVLGVCNGFQVLTESGLLPGALLRNAGLKFVCREVHLSVETSQSIFTNGYEAGQVLRVPVAHHDGQYYADDETLARLRDQDRIAFRYAAGDSPGPANPNGSVDDIAGIYNEAKTVLGLMPHPEDAVDPAHGGTDGRALFEGLARALR
ncbi:MAG: phosphoribosylformylglycinamidine synthase subunit PurQ [Alphaproteobacteria bacterium]|nr:phosphoribosylformylglycinamidine synthase subunit PurQ [Alphaproteobacteria bacterium]